jgi:hypothetical protein
VELKLSKGYFATVDDNDPKSPWNLKWTAKVRRSGKVYAARVIDGKSVYLHRYLLGVYDPSIKVDHKDGNGLNNSRSNLRKATVNQNNYNSEKPKNNTSGIKGVSWNKWHQKWTAFINVNGKRFYLGVFREKLEAEIAVTAARLEKHKEFARS